MGKVLKIFRKTIEITLDAASKDYPLDKYQVLNNKPIVRLVIPQINFTFYALANYGGTGTYTTNPQSISGKVLARVEAIDGAYLNLTNMGNQLTDDSIPLKLYRQDPEYFGKKGLFEDEPKIDFTQSKIWYPTLLIPTAETTRSIQIVVDYKDWYEE